MELHKVVESQYYITWDEVSKYSFDLKYIKAAFKSGYDKDTNDILARVSSKCKMKQKIEDLKKQSIQYINEITKIAEIQNQQQIKELNMKLSLMLSQRNKIPSVAQEVLEQLQKIKGKAAAKLLYILFKGYLDNGDHKFAEQCVKYLMRGDASSIFHNYKVSPKGIENLMLAEISMAKKNYKIAEKHIKLFVVCDPILESLFKLLWKYKRDTTTFALSKTEYFKHPESVRAQKQLLEKIIKTGNTEKILQGMNTIQNLGEKEQFTFLLEISKKILNIHKGIVSDDDSAISVILNIYLAIKNNGIPELKDNLQTQDLIAELISNREKREEYIGILTQCCYLLHSFGYNNAAASFAGNLMEVLNIIYESIKSKSNIVLGEQSKEDPENLCKIIQKRTISIIAIFSSSLLNMNLSEKAEEVLSIVFIYLY